MYFSLSSSIILVAYARFSKLCWMRKQQLAVLPCLRDRKTSLEYLGSPKYWLSLFAWDTVFAMLVVGRLQVRSLHSASGSWVLGLQAWTHWPGFSHWSFVIPRGVIHFYGGQLFPLANCFLMDMVTLLWPLRGGYSQTQWHLSERLASVSPSPPWWVCCGFTWLTSLWLLPLPSSAVGGSEPFRSYWDKYLPNGWLLIFVVDSADHERLPEAKKCLHQLLEQNPRLPLVVFANKQVKKKSVQIWLCGRAPRLAFC